VGLVEVFTGPTKTVPWFWLDHPPFPKVLSFHYQATYIDHQCYTLGILREVSYENTKDSLPHTHRLGTYQAWTLSLFPEGVSSILWRRISHPPTWCLAAQLAQGSHFRRECKHWCLERDGLLKYADREHGDGSYLRLSPLLDHSNCTARNHGPIHLLSYAESQSRENWEDLRTKMTYDEGHASPARATTLIFG